MSPEASKQPPTFADYTLRELPIEGEFLSLTSEIAALLDRNDRHLQDVEDQHAGQVADMHASAGRVVQLVCHLETALGDCQDAMDQADLSRPFRRLRIIKDQLKDHLARSGYRWQDPTGRPFTEELAEQVQVDGWRHDDQFTVETVAETREPVVLLDDELLLPGAVIVGAPDT